MTTLEKIGLLWFILWAVIMGSEIATDNTNVGGLLAAYVLAFIGGVVFVCGGKRNK